MAFGRARSAPRRGDRSAPLAEISALAAKGVALNPDAKTAGTVETLVVAVKPQMFREAGAGLKPFVSDKTAVVSIMAGTTIASLEEVCGGAVVRAMPNTPAAIGRGITVAVAARNVSAAQRAVADALLRATGSVEWVDDESLMDAVTAVSGSGPAYVFLLAEELARAGVEAGLPEALATKLARETVAGSGELLHRSELAVEHAAPERHLARRHHRRRPRRADGRARPARSDDPRDRGRDEAVEGTGEVARCVGVAGRARHESVSVPPLRFATAEGWWATALRAFAATLRLRCRRSAPSRLLNISTLTSPRAWRPSPSLRAPSKRLDLEADDAALDRDHLRGGPHRRADERALQDGGCRPRCRR